LWDLLHSCQTALKASKQLSLYYSRYQTTITPQLRNALRFKSAYLIGSIIDPVCSALNHSLLWYTARQIKPDSLPQEHPSSNAPIKKHVMVLWVLTGLQTAAYLSHLYFGWNYPDTQKLKIIGFILRTLGARAMLTPA
jgi:hypothetical protein